MTANPAYNFSQTNVNRLAQNLSGLSLNFNQQFRFPQQQQQRRQPPPQHYHHQQQQQQHYSVNIDGYIPPSLYGNDNDVISPHELNVTYERGSTVIRAQNNSSIDDYYSKFFRPETDYVNIETGTTSDAKTKNKEKKKDKSKHKKGSPKQGQLENDKSATDLKETTVTNDNTVQAQQQAAPVVVPQVAAPAIPQVAAPVVPPVAAPVVAPTAAPIAAAVRPPTSSLPAGNTQTAMKNNSNPVVFFDIEIDGAPRGRLIMELFRHALPRTAQNFLSLSLNERGYGYRNSFFHRIIPGFMAQAGDFEKSDGTGGYSIYGEKFNDEGFHFKHDKAGLLSMANSGPNTNGSQFFITFGPCAHLDNKHVVFGQVLQGFHILKDLEMSGSDDGDVTREAKIANTGKLK